MANVLSDGPFSVVADVATVFGFGVVPVGKAVGATGG